MARNVTLRPWPGQEPSPKKREILATSEPSKNITDADRRLLLSSLTCLQLDYMLGINRLMRALKLSSDIKTTIENRKNLPETFVDDIAKAVGLSRTELLAIQTLSSEQQAQLKTVVRERDLIQQPRGFMIPRIRARVKSGG